MLRCRELTLCPQHEREEFVREWQRVIARAVMRHQKPTRQTLVNVGACVCDGGVCRLHRKGLNEFE
jgi:hypothetical protein